MIVVIVFKKERDKEEFLQKSNVTVLINALR